MHVSPHRALWAPGVTVFLASLTLGALLSLAPLSDSTAQAEELVSAPELVASSAKDKKKPTPAPTATPAPAATAGDSDASNPAAPAATPTPTSTSTVIGPANEKYRVVGTDGEGLRIREKPSLSAPIIARIAEGTVVSRGSGPLTEAEGVKWMPVQAGWAAQRYLTRIVTYTPVVRPLPADATLAMKAVDTAVKQVGKPYVFGGNGPNAFDCSGFVQWVFAQAGVKEMPRLIPDQMAIAKQVPTGQPLQPGDLLVYVNTYTPGISHVGIVVAKDIFVHAADEWQGVTFSNMNDEYWTSRYYGAYRIQK